MKYLSNSPADTKQHKISKKYLLNYLLFDRSSHLSSEFAQSLTRSVVTLACLFTLQIVVFFHGLDKLQQTALNFVFLYFVFSLFYCYFVYKFPQRFQLRRYFIVLMDNLLISYCVYSFGIAGAAFYPLYLWVSIENGFRFGANFLHYSSAVSVLSFTLAVILSDPWMQQLEIAIGLSMGMLIMPLFFLILLKQLNDTNSQLQNKMDEAEYLATHDSLTGLPNRLYLEQRFSKAIKLAQKKGHEIAIFFIDINAFKNINDTLGHDTGDQFIQQFATRLSYCLRSTDTLARLGADSFMMLLESKQPDSYASQVANRIIEQAAGRYDLNGYEIYSTFSAGIAVFPHHGKSVEALIKNADTALHYAKTNNKPAYRFYDKSMSKEVSEELQLQNDLRRALENHEFELHYQPQVDASTQEILGAEALLRWNHPDKGLLYPKDFIDVAEKNGLMIELGNWILETACSDREQWNRLGFHNLVATINVSGHQFMDEDFITHLTSMFDKYKLRKNQIGLEITERILVEELDLVKDIFNQLKHANVKLALDDFGTGYSSLSYLKRFPIDTIKIDQSFVRDLPGNSEDSSLVQTILAIGSNLNMQVVAEGVETREQYKLLRDWGCKSIQGYYFGKPQSQKGFLKRLRENNPFPDVNLSIAGKSA